MTSPNRQPRGVPAGGQFSKHQHAEADIALTGSRPDDDITFSEAKAMARLWYSIHDATADFALHGRITDEGIAAWKAKRQRSVESNDPFAPTAVAEMDQVISYLERRRISHGLT